MTFSHLSLAVRLAASVLVAGASAGCGKKGNAPPTDAGAEAAADVRPPLSLDIAVAGCAVLDGATARCSGPAPLVLSFSPVGSPDFTRFSWRFGDGTPMSTERAPVHSYALPGTYEVTLIGAGDVGNIPSNRPINVIVEPVSVGRPCDVDAQCAADLACVCQPRTGCPAAFVRGVCSSACDSTACAPGGACALLGGAFALASDAGAKSPRCLGACQTSADCAPGFVCQTVPAGGAPASGRWVLACLPDGALGDLGAPCRSATGELDDATCATGTCADLGALGSCSAVCDADHACPTTTACARFLDGRQLCLVDCANTECTRDPLLECPKPDGGEAIGPGFQTDAGADTKFCAPKPCSSDSVCAPSGRCGPSAHCARI